MAGSPAPLGPADRLNFVEFPLGRNDFDLEDPAEPDRLTLVCPGDATYDLDGGVRVRGLTRLITDGVG